MRKGLSIKVVGLSVSAFLAVTYAICVVAALLLPNGGMAATLGGMMGWLGFGWSAVGLVIGLAWAIVLGFYIALVFVPIYNFLEQREKRAPAEAGPRLGSPVASVR